MKRKLLLVAGVLAIFGGVAGVVFFQFQRLDLLLIPPGLTREIDAVVIQNTTSNTIVINREAFKTNNGIGENHTCPPKIILVNDLGGKTFSIDNGNVSVDAHNSLYVNAGIIGVCYMGLFTYGDWRTPRQETVFNCQMKGLFDAAHQSGMTYQQFDDLVLRIYGFRSFFSESSYDHLMPIELPVAYLR